MSYKEISKAFFPFWMLNIFIWKVKLAFFLFCVLRSVVPVQNFLSSAPYSSYNARNAGAQDLGNSKSWTRALALLGTYKKTQMVCKLWSTVHEISKIAKIALETTFDRELGEETSVWELWNQNKTLLLNCTSHGRCFLAILGTWNLTVFIGLSNLCLRRRQTHEINNFATNSPTKIWFFSPFDLITATFVSFPRRLQVFRRV